MATKPSTTSTTSTKPATCYLCGRATYVVLSHATGGRNYVYAWCATCGHGTYQAA